MSQQTKKRNIISALQKREICLLKKNIPEPKNIDLAKQFEISPGQVTDILKNSAKWFAIDPNSYQANLKKTRSSNLPKVEEALIIWIEKALECNLTITGFLIQQKALQFAELLGTTDFKASSGWLEKFKKRYSISAFNKHGESQSAPIKEIPKMREDLKAVIKQYQPDDVFNCDETGLYWKMEPTRGLSTGPLSGTKQSKDRITILLTCNATGTEKLIPLFIHKYQNPRPLNGISKSSLPVDYYWNSKAWMQISIWNDYLKKLDNKMRRANRNILLLIDNAPTHNLLDSLNLTNVTIHCLPPNTTSHLQPLDAGIIHSFKVCTLIQVNINYHRHVLKPFIIVYRLIIGNCYLRKR
jgi:hypothetical protein